MVYLSRDLAGGGSDQPAATRPPAPTQPIGPTATPEVQPAATDRPSVTPTPRPIATPEPPPVSAAAVGEVEPIADREIRIAAYLAGRPLEPFAGDMVRLADLYGLDWRLLPAITMLESGAGRQACGFNTTGYANCDAGFASYLEGLERSAATLAGYGGDSARQACVWQQGTTGCAEGRAANYVARVLAEMARE